MAVEIGVVCPKRPDPEPLALATGFVMRTILGVSNIEVELVVEEEDTWTFHWGGAGQAAAFLVPPRMHEFAGQWFASFQPGTRGEPVPAMLMIVLAACAALLTGGTILDEAHQFERTDLTPDAVLGPALRMSPLSPEAALHLLRTGRSEAR
ncbi:hypothetical protein [Nonomuraea sp. SYSU D8015]|uniref:hypothetical protein n=1 Tax=Nonomuraea sp. SYSU D8015 TaxID=2593644 RepID=UPI0016605A02|nr:hypothetical protein [Nonomuraea sp. SYSU D8015]